MVVGEPNINNIMGGIENTGSVRLHNHRKKLKQRFDIIKKLGQGTYGKVQLGINKETGQEVAIKTIKKSKIETEADLVRIRREIQIMSSVQHPNIIHIYEVFENREKMVLVMEYAAGGELYDYLSERKVLTEEEARRIFRQISTACYYCHKHKICHRDLKLENILLDENGNAKIADFGLSNVFDERRLLQTFCGSPLYASPEIVKGTPYHGPEVDCWSLGVLLYTLVYGAMPFDGSNFKRLVKQISQGDYFEPKKPSRASPLIKDMLTVNPRNRADIEKICAHWWVNEGYDESCLEISEELANQTPVRLDLLLSLAPPPPQLESEKLVVTGEIAEEAAISTEGAGPTKSQSVGSLMELSSPARRRIEDLINDEGKPSKRKLETTISTDQANLSKEGVKKKEKIIKENTIADITSQPTIHEDEPGEETKMSEGVIKSETRTLSREMDVEQSDPSTQGAACSELIEDAKKKSFKNTVEPNEVPVKAAKEQEIPSSQEANKVSVDKENVKVVKEKKEGKEEKQKPESKIPAKRKVVKKKVLTDKNENASKAVTPEETKPEKKSESPKKEDVKGEESQPAKVVERRRSRIFETAEKFQNMISANEQKPAEKPKKVTIPGVSVGGFKKEFERKASLTSGSILLPKGTMTVKPGTTEYQKPAEIEKKPEKVQPSKIEEKSKEEKLMEEQQLEESKELARRTQVKNAVDIISNALDKDGARKSKSRPCMVRKPPVPFGVSGRSASGSIGIVSSPPPIEKFRQPILSEVRVVHGSTPEQVIEQPQEERPEESKTSSAEITLKSATLPRRKTTKAEIKLDYPSAKVAPMGFKTEMAHHVQAAPKLPTQKSEAAFPVSSPLSPPSHRSASVEPETKSRTVKERIIPISFERDVDGKKEVPLPRNAERILQTQKSTTSSQGSSNLSRQSTQDSDSETTVSREPIRKSPREYIIPIAVEGGGYVTPRAGSLEPSETSSTTSTMKSKFRRRFMDRDGSEEDGPFAALHRHSSFGKDSDPEDPKRDAFRMHSLRSSRPRKAMMEHNDSFSSGEDDDDDGFEILTAENLFSTLLSRVRDLTQRMNVDGRPSFQNSRLLSGHFDHGTNFWNLHNRADPLSRRSPLGRSFNREQSADNSSQFGTPWRRSVSRDLASDIDSVFSNSSIPTQSTTLPRGDKETNKDNLNLSDLNLKKLKLSDEDALALSYLTPGLSRRIQKQLLAQLAPAAARKLSRTLSMRNSIDRSDVPSKMSRRSADPCTVSRRYSVESNPCKYERSRSGLDEYEEDDVKEPVTPRRTENRFSKSFIPVNSPFRDPDSPDRSTESSAYTEMRPAKSVLSPSAIEAKLSAKSDSSTSESLSSYKTEDPSSLFKSSSSLSSKPSLITKPASSTYGPFSSEASRLSKYLDPPPKFEPRPYSPPQETEKSNPILSSPKPRRSRFLRPDFYESSNKPEPTKEEHYLLRDKKEREIEAQQILQEIRDRRERKASRDTRMPEYEDRSANYTEPKKTTSCLEEYTKLFKDDAAAKPSKNSSDTEATEMLLKNVSDNIRKLESSVQTFHDYVNIPGENKKLHDYVNVSDESTKIPDYVNVRDVENEAQSAPTKKERVSRIARPKSYPAESYDSKDSSPKPCYSNESKSRISRLKQPEKVFKGKEENEKPTTKNKFLQSIEKKLEKLRSFSNSPTSGSDESKSRDERRSSVENTIKRLREHSLPKNAEPCITESGLIKRAVSVEDLSNNDGVPDPKQLQTSRKSVTKILNLFKKYEDKKGDKISKNKKSKDSEDGNENAKSNSQLQSEKTENIGANTVISNSYIHDDDEDDVKLRSSNTRSLKSPSEENDGEHFTSSKKQTERPKSLMFDRTKQFQPTYNGAKSESNITNEKEVKMRTSKLPVTAFRRSFNMDSEPQRKGDRQTLKLDLHRQSDPSPGTSKSETNRSKKNSDDTLTFLSPTEDSGDSWSACSEYHSQDITSPVSPGNFFSADENDSVSDRIRRKSFYMRFNENKRPRKSSKGSYKDLDLYKENQRKSVLKTPVDYGSLDRKSKYGSLDAAKKERRNSRGSSVLSDDNTSMRYPAYSPRIARRSSSSTRESEDCNSLDDTSATEKNRLNSYHSPNTKPVSPSNGQALYTGQSS